MSDVFDCLEVHYGMPSDLDETIATGCARLPSTQNNIKSHQPIKNMTWCWNYGL
jgi:hypothetical protein